MDKLAATVPSFPLTAVRDHFIQASQLVVAPAPEPGSIEELA